VNGNGNCNCNCNLTQSRRGAEESTPFRRIAPEAEAMLAATGFRVVGGEQRAIDWLWELMVIEAV